VSENPALRCKLGQIFFEEGHLAAAQEQLSLAYSCGGEAVFADEDPKYRELIAVDKG
jgi:hypothetical protein